MSESESSQLTKPSAEAAAAIVADQEASQVKRQVKAKATKRVTSAGSPVTLKTLSPAERMTSERAALRYGRNPPSWPEARFAREAEST